MVKQTFSMDEVLEDADPVEEAEVTSDTDIAFGPADIHSGVASLPKPKSKEEELQKRRDMAVYGGFGMGMGVPGLLPSDPLPRIIPAAIGDVAGSPFTFSQFVGELVAPETTKKVTDFVGNIDKELQKNHQQTYLPKGQVYPSQLPPAPVQYNREIQLVSQNYQRYFCEATLYEVRQENP